MSRPLFCLATLLLTIHLGCSGPSRVQAPSINAAGAGTAALEKYDTNQDGKIAGEEINASPALLSALKRIDTDGDQAISAEEITARIEKWQAGKIGLTSARCVVTYRGQPLPNAKVVFEPESFLGDAIKAGEGTTGQTGNTSIKQPENKLPGMPLGFYNVKVTSDSMQIPVTYNDSTILGAEIAPSNPESAVGFRFNLK